MEPRLQKAIQQISKAAALPAAEPVFVPMAAIAPPVISEGAESMRALANLARIVSGRPTAAGGSHELDGRPRERRDNERRLSRRGRDSG